MIKIDYIGDKDFVFDKKLPSYLRHLIRLSMPVFDIWWFFLLIIARCKREKIRANKYKFSICAIFKNETLSLKEWIEYHLLIGVDHFYLYNNNSDDDYITILKPYIERGIVTLIEWPIAPPSQVPAYKHFYENFKKDNQWIAFIDLDEYICPRRCDDIKEWITKYDNYPSVVAYWKMFGASGLFKHDRNKLITEQYYQCWDRLYDYGKTFFNLNFDVFDFNVKFIHELPCGCKILGKNFLIPPINEFKYFIHFKCHRIGAFKSKNDFTIQLNHYASKSYEEFFISKRKRGAASSTGDRAKHIRSAYAFLRNQHLSIATDYAIQRFLIQLKVNMGIYPDYINSDNNI